MNRVMAVGLAGMLLASPLLPARDKSPAAISKGMQIGVVNLMDAEVAHYHAARDIKDNFLKVEPVSWSVGDMLNDVVKDQLGKMGLTPVPLTMTASAVHFREECVVNIALAKGLPKGWAKTCAAPLAALAAGSGVRAVILLSPGVNNPDHAGSSNRDGLSETLRGWGVFTREYGGSQEKPTLFDKTELLLIGITPEGVTLLARKWGGTLSMQWQAYTRSADPKGISAAQLDELQPLFAAVLARQVKELLDQLHVEQ
jgi:hypothetical protein